ncbi:hypothetical protein [Marinicella rhabdoformis]|uniref:hypothetical protein n=1 Tax=Marinicella rhabdoformis TaxID=2580566 RepID=UPI0012AED930|nr:hypothetical protein [Marinicella rhabdoformis]
MTAYSNIATMNRSFQFAAPYVALISFIIFAVSIYKRNDFTQTLKALPELSSEPKQSPINRPAFLTEYNKETFEVIPKYDYEIYGLVVSYRLHDANGSTMIHDLNKDHLNVADFCVVWGTSADPQLLKAMEFSNGQFTCNYGASSHQVWEDFNHNQLSNNHLLATDENIRSAIDRIRIGDQIHIKGWLSHYVNPMGYERGTSTTRTDTGNGACETVFVNEIHILQSMSTEWRHLIWLSFLSLSAALWTIYHTPVVARQYEKSKNK